MGTDLGGGENMSYYIITAMWDEAAGVFVAQSDDIPGLVTEAETFEKLVERVLQIAPELLALNKVPPRDHGRQIKVVATRSAMMAAAA